MKKNYYLLLLVLAMSISANAQIQWVNTKLDEKISVKFPSEPEKKTANGSLTFTVKTKDSLTFTASVLDYQIIAKIDSAGLAAMKDTPGFADQLRAGISMQRKDYELGSIKVGDWKTYTSYEILGKKISDNKKLYLKMVIVGSKMYGLACLAPDQFVTKESELFLNSMELITVNP